MSFRTRLTSFFVLIVIIPMVAVGFLVFRLISDSQQGKAAARVNALATAAASLYRNESIAADVDAKTIAVAVSRPGSESVPARVAALQAQAGLARVEVREGSRTLADVGDRTAVAPGIATVVRVGRHPQLTVTASELTASQFVSDLTGPGEGLVVSSGSHTLASSFSTVRSPPRSGSVRVAGNNYQTLAQSLPAFGSGRIEVTVLSAMATGSVAGPRILAAAFILAVLVLAFSFSVLASRGLHGQVSRFLQAARRLGSGDFSSPIPIEGRDEFAELGAEFNSMSKELERRLDELGRERARLREAISRIGQTLASNLDRRALVELALKTAIDAVEADSGRVSARSSTDEPLAEIGREGSLVGLEGAIMEAERAAIGSGGPGESAVGDGRVIAVPLSTPEAGGKPYGVITVVRRNGSITDQDRELLRSLATQATLALENVELHRQVSHQAVTDELTGLVNHGRFQELLSSEIEQVRRYRHPLGLIMLDIDNFKQVNDTYGHQQGDIVLKQVARVVADTSREADFPARYGGEEMALILPHTDIEGSYAIAERIRAGIEALRVPRTDNEGILRVTASVGVAATANGRDDLIAEADSALYEAKRSGKNRTVKAADRATNVLGAE